MRSTRGLIALAIVLAMMAMSLQAAGTTPLQFGDLQCTSSPASLLHYDFREGAPGSGTAQGALAAYLPIDFPALSTSQFTVHYSDSTLTQYKRVESGAVTLIINARNPGTGWFTTHIYACPTIIVLGGTHTDRVSLSSTGAQATQDSRRGAAAGFHVAFSSLAPNLIASDTNGVPDLFVRDIVTKSTIRISVASDGTQANDESFGPAFSGAPKVVAFTSYASNLVASDTNGVTDVFVRDRDTDSDGLLDEAGGVSTIRVSMSYSGAQSNGHSEDPSLSDSGRFVAFESMASNLVSGDTNAKGDIFIRDRDTDNDRIFDEVGAVLTRRISVTSGGVQANGHSFDPSISASGRFITFSSSASNLIASDTNGAIDVFLHDRDTDQDSIFDETGATATTRVSVSSSGIQGNGQSDDPDIAPEGRFIAYSSLASNLYPLDSNGRQDVFVYDRILGTTTIVSKNSVGQYATNNGDSFDPQISEGGRLIAFSSRASTLVGGDTNLDLDAFLHDRDTDMDGILDEVGSISTTALSVSTAGVVGDFESREPFMTTDGSVFGFTSDAWNLAPNDTNMKADIFVRSAP